MDVEKKEGIHHEFTAEMQIHNEWLFKRGETKEQILKKKILKDILLIKNGHTERKQLLRECLKINKGQESQLNLKTLREAHNIYFSRDNLGNKWEVMTTPKERLLADWLRRYSKSKFYQSFWIGNHCVDFFFPRQSLVIEINGDIHFREFKMRKDKLRDKRLMKKLNVVVWEVHNTDVNLLRFKILDHLKFHKVEHSDKVRNLMRDIYIENLSRMCTIDQLELIFKIPFNNIYQIYLESNL